jgi:hypothetical protein
LVGENAEVNINHNVNITILTAVLNNNAGLEKLGNGIFKKSLSWIVIDGSLTPNPDGRTVVERLGGNYIWFPGSSIYAAINRGVENVLTDYYMVLGADDELIDSVEDEAVRNVVQYGDFDLLGLNWMFNDRIIKPTFRSISLDGYHAVLGNHSGGVIVKKHLHQRFGMYDEAFKISADSYFLLDSITGGAAIAYIPICFCVVGAKGVSRKRRFKSEVEFFTVLIRLKCFGIFDAIERISRNIYSALRGC